MRLPRVFPSLTLRQRLLLTLWPWLMPVLIVGGGAALGDIVVFRWRLNDLRPLVVAEARARLNADLSVGSLSGSLLGKVRLDRLSLKEPGEGGPLAKAKSVSVRFGLWRLLKGECPPAAAVEKIEVQGLEAWVRRDAQGRLYWAQLVKPRPPTTPVFQAAIHARDAIVHYEDWDLPPEGRGPVQVTVKGLDATVTFPHPTLVYIALSGVPEGDLPAERVESDIWLDAANGTKRTDTRLTAADPAPLFQLLNRERRLRAVRGRLDVRARTLASRQSVKPSVSVVASTEGLGLDTTLLPRRITVQGRVRLGSDSLLVQGMNVSWGKSRATISGGITDLTRPSAVLDIGLQGVWLEDLGRALPLPKGWAASGAVRGQVGLTGLLRKPVVSAQLQPVGVSVRGPHGVQFRVDDGRIAGQSLGGDFWQVGLALGRISGRAAGRSFVAQGMAGGGVGKGLVGLEGKAVAKVEDLLPGLSPTLEADFFLSPAQLAVARARGEAFGAEIQATGGIEFGKGKPKATLQLVGRGVDVAAALDRMGVRRPAFVHGKASGGVVLRVGGDDWQADWAGSLDSPVLIQGIMLERVEALGEISNKEGARAEVTFRGSALSGNAMFAVDRRQNLRAQVSVERLDGALLRGWAGLPEAGGHASAMIQVAGTLESPVVRGLVLLEDLSPTPQARLAGLLRLSGDLDRLTLHESVLRGPMGRVLVSGEVRDLRAGRLAEVEGRARATLTAPSGLIEYQGPRLSGPVQVTADLSGSLADPRVWLDLEGHEVRLGEQPIESVQGRAEYRGGTLTVKDLVLRSPWAEVSGQGSLQPGGEGAVSGRFLLSEVDLERAIPLVAKPPVAVKGTADMTIEVSGTWRAPQGHFRLDGGNLRAGDVIVSRLSARGVADRGGVSAEEVEARGPSGLVRGSFAYRRGDRWVQAKGRASDLAIADLERTYRLLRPAPIREAPPEIRARLREGGQVRLGGTLDAEFNLAGRYDRENGDLPKGEVSLQTRGLRLGDSALPEVVARVQASGRRVHVRELRLVQGRAALVASGYFEPKGSLRLAASASGFEVGPVARLLNLQVPVEGEVNLTLAARGPVKEPQIEGTAEAVVVRAGAVVLDRVECERFSLAEGALRLDGVRAERGEDIARGSVVLPFRWEDKRIPRDQPIRVVGQLKRIHLERWQSLLPKGVRLQGSFDAVGAITGTLSRPLVTGEARLKRGVAGYEPLGLTARNLELSAQLSASASGTTVRLRFLRGRLLDGDLVAAGQANLVSFAPASLWRQDYDLTLTLEDFSLRQAKRLAVAPVEQPAGYRGDLRLALRTPKGESARLEIEHLRLGTQERGSTLVTGSIGLREASPQRFLYNDFHLSLEARDLLAQWDPYFRGRVDGVLKFETMTPGQPPKVAGALVASKGIIYLVSPKPEAAGVPMALLPLGTPALSVAVRIGEGVVLKAPPGELAVIPVKGQVQISRNLGGPLSAHASLEAVPGGKMTSLSERWQVEALQAQAFVQIRAQDEFLYPIGEAGAEAGERTRVVIPAEVARQPVNVSGQMNLVAHTTKVYQKREYRLTMHLYGPLTDLHAEFSSEPYLPEQEIYALLGQRQLVSRILAGGSVKDLMGEEALQIATTAFGAAILNPLAARLAQTLGLEDVYLTYDLEKTMTVAITERVLGELMVSATVYVGAQEESKRYSLSFSYPLTTDLSLAVATDETGNLQNLRYRGQFHRRF